MINNYRLLIKHVKSKLSAIHDISDPRVKVERFIIISWKRIATLDNCVLRISILRNFTNLFKTGMQMIPIYLEEIKSVGM